MKKVFSKSLSILLSVVVIFGVFMTAKVTDIEANAAANITTQDIQKILDKYGYTTGNYWTMYDYPNYGGSDCGATVQTINSELYASSNPAKTSNSGIKSYKSYNFNNSWQCHGFALYVMSKVTGNSVSSSGGTNWTKITSVPSSLQVGDIIRTSGHTAIVLTANNGRYTFAECWGSVNSKISIGKGFNYDYYTIGDITSHDTFQYVLRYGGSSGSTPTTPSGNNSQPNKNIVNAGDDFYAEIVFNKNSKLSLSNVNGNVELQSRSSTDGKKVWHFKRQSDGSYTIISCFDNKAMDVSGANDANGTNIQTYQSNGTKAQKWYVLGSSSNFILQPESSSSRVLDIYGAGNVANKNAQLYDSNGTGAQIFSINKVSANLGTDFYAEIVYNKNSKLSLANVNGNVELQSRNNTDVKKVWHFKRQSDGSYTIISCFDNKVLDVSGAKDANSTNIQTYESNGTVAQKWYISGSSGSFVLQPESSSSRVLDISGAGTTAGTNAQLYDSNGTGAQYFSINKVNIPTLTVPVTSVKLSKTSLTLGKGKSQTIIATVAPTNATTKTVKWTTSNSKVATVSNGKITAKGVGTATITATAANGKKATCKVTVKNLPTSVKLNKASATVKKGNTLTLKATVSPSKNIISTLTWSSSNTKVATVKNGKITAKAKGTATITVKTTNGKTAKCKITVK